MCGICGIAGFEDRQLLESMCSVMQHRGPDDGGLYTDSNIGLGHQRLSVIDLESGHQPIHNEDETVWTVFNGEVYNFRELRSVLEKQGHTFYTSTDTEVLVHLYEQYGTGFVKELRGMFAFALWDSDKKRLLLARDGMGVKPLYYTVVDGKLLFASEIKSLLQYEGVKLAVNLHALHDYLTLRHSLGTETMFSGIYKLLPGHILTFQDGKMSTERYWDISFKVESGKSEDYYSKRLLELLNESVKMRLVSDVPLGVFLSGGLDSSVITGLMSRMVDEPIETFTVGFGEHGEIGELEQARAVSDYFGTNHHELLVEQGAFKENLADIVWHMDEPVADPAALPLYLLSEMTKKHVTVVLGGDGGDEQFGGYVSYKMGLLNKYYQQAVPGLVRHNLLNPVLRSIPNVNSKVHVGLGCLTAGTAPHGFLTAKSVFSEDDKHSLYTDDVLNEIGDYDSSDWTVDMFFTKPKDAFLNRMMYSDSKTFLVDDILLVKDKMTMASGLEARVPLIDTKVVEFAASIPPHLKLKGLDEKYILKKAARDILPPATQDRKKRPFRIPINTWFKDELKEIALQVMSDSVVEKEGYFKPQQVENILRKHSQSKLLYNHQLYTLLVFEVWHKTFMEGDSRGIIDLL